MERESEGHGKTEAIRDALEKGEPVSSLLPDNPSAPEEQWKDAYLGRSAEMKKRDAKQSKASLDEFRRMMKEIDEAKTIEEKMALLNRTRQFLREQKEASTSEGGT
ncbi:hypothetical protein J6U76_01605 [bacterium]|nr:hypothetical protein [bacterium]